MKDDVFEIELQELKTTVIEHNKNRKWWQPKWKLIENMLFYTITYNGFPNPFNIHETIYGLSWTAFPKEHHTLLKPEELQWNSFDG